MIDGITVLSKVVTSVDTGLTCWGWSPVAFVGILFGILAIIMIIYMCCEKDYLFGLCVMSIALVSCVVLWHQKPITEEVYEYRALIEETTSFTEFSENYILLDKDGDIWCFRERTSAERFD